MLMTPLYILQLYSPKLLLSTRDFHDLERIASGELVMFNDQKTQFQLMTSNIEIDPNIIYKNTIIEPTKSFHMLGLIVSSHLTWKPHIKQIVKSASAQDI